MPYMDDHGGKDDAKTTDGLNYYSGGEQTTETTTEQQTSKQTQSQTQAGSGTQTEKETTQAPKGGLLSRLRRALLGDKTMGEKAKQGVTSWRAAMSGEGGGILGKAAKTLLKPKALAALAAAGGIGVFSIFGLFTTYKNDGVVRNDPPIECEQGELELPQGESGDNDIQANVDIMYSIFCEEFGYSKEALMGMVACMGVESMVNPDRLESDFILISEKEQFDKNAGPNTAPGGEATLQEYYTYGEGFMARGGWNGNDAYLVDGKMCCGIGLIQWTGGRGIKLCEGLDKVDQEVSVMDLHYQCAFLLAELQKSYKDCAPGSAFASMTDPTEATQFFFKTVVSGGSLNDVDKRLACLDDIGGGPGARDLVGSAHANAQFTQDTVSMAELLADDSFSTAVAKSSHIQLCTNKTVVDVSSIAKAAVSISFLERGDYEDVQGAYGMYRRSARSPVMINDWNFIEGKDRDPSSLLPYDGPDGTYGSKRGVPATNPKSKLKLYEINEGGGKHDLIACTEYYYYAHLIAFPKETGRGNPGYFSSCDRGTGTAVRIAGADDKFPAGNPKYQLSHAVGAAKQGAQHDPDKRLPQGNGALWAFAGFLRGCDYYSASGSGSIAPGTVMISWDVKGANGYLGANDGGNATDSGVLADGDDGGDGGGDPADPGEVDDSDEAADGKLKLANLRWPMSVTNTTRHIITFVGEDTVQDFWGLDWLFQQWSLFDDADRLIRGDLTIEVPEIMKQGLSYKSKTAGKSVDQKMTFYKAQAEGSKNHDDLKESDISGRRTEFNSKTGLPEFKSWEEIFVRLIHNSDDDAAAEHVSGEDELYIQMEPNFEDNYLDDAGEEDKIEQYQGEKTYGNKYFYEDWNSIGAGKAGDPTDDDYNGVDERDLLWYDDGSDEWTYDKNAADNPYWRYELVADFEYRMNQLMRFGMASMMCSVASEEDADVFQTGSEGNDAGHILGNIYRRYSRIPDETDVSGRYYYFNTVVSNDMLQDLVQLWSLERNGDKGHYTERSFGPMYMLADGSLGYGAYAGTKATSQTAGWLDRRYGLTMADIKELMGSTDGSEKMFGGIGGMHMGLQDADSANEKLGKFMNNPMHKLSTAQKALYNRLLKSDLQGNTDQRDAHESDHEFMPEGEYYSQELYGVNPFLMLENEDNLNYRRNQGLDDWSAAGGGSEGVRNGLDGKVHGSEYHNGSGTTAKGVDGDSTFEDDRLAWIDRHYYQTGFGNIGTYAYLGAGLNPSVGHIIADSAYENGLKSVKTLDATETSGTGEHGGQTDADNLYGSWKKLRYTDFTYAETKNDNHEMAKRLFGKDDRNDDSNEVRDDYNQREWIVIPYYHTHAQMCDHSHLSGYGHYILPCKWWDNTAECPNPDHYMIDTQTYLNTHYNSTTDHGDTISFGAIVNNRGKYDLSEVLNANRSGDTKVRYFTDKGMEILEDDRPYIHVECDGWTQSVSCTCEKCNCTSPESCCCAVRCHACHGWIWCGDPVHVHPCSDCLAGNWCHDHTECDSALNTNRRGIDCHGCDPTPGACPVGYQHHQDGGSKGQQHYSFHMSGTTDDCHDMFGCSALEFFYHNPGEYSKVNRKTGVGGSNGTIVGTNDPVNALYMAICIVDDPKSDFDIHDWMVGGSVVPDKGNLIQRVTYRESDGFVRYTWEDMVSPTPASLTNPNISGYYPNAIHHISFTEGKWTAGADNSRHAIGYDASGGRQGLLGYFTLEGNLIRDPMGDTNAETLSDYTKNCKPEDLQRVESVRNRVGLGKSAPAQTVNGVATNVRQSASARTGLEEIKFDRSPHGEAHIDSNYGYGEIQVTGTQHGADPTDSSDGDGYGPLDVCGPDGSKGNKKNGFGNSLLRCILGDEHVAHITFGSQSREGLIDEDEDNGRDFMFYVDGKRMREHFEGKNGVAKCESGNRYTDDPEKVSQGYILMPEIFEPSYWHDPANTCPGCGKHIIPDPDDKTIGDDVYNDPNGEYLIGRTRSMTDMDEDMKYLDPDTNLPTDKEYYDRRQKKCVDTPTSTDKDGNTYDNERNKQLTASGTGDDRIANAPSGSFADKAVNGGDADGTSRDGKGSNGDYRLWVTHASRGTRGMMTQYLNFKGFFHYVHKKGGSDSEFAYMLFTVINRTDQAPPKGSGDADNDGDLLEDFVYASSPGDAANTSPHRVWGSGSVEIKNEAGEVIGYKPAQFSDTYGQGSNSHWKNLIDVYNAAMSETRHFD